MRTETINKIEYEIGKLNAFEQLHVGRKLAPLLAHAIPALLKIAEVDGAAVNLQTLLITSAAAPIADVLCRMDEADVDYIVNKCLATCQRRQAKNWAKVMSSNGQIMFADIELDT